MDSNTMDTMMGSTKTTYGTPLDFFKRLNDIFDFTLDVCAWKKNTMVQESYITPDQDALKQPWNGRFWMNPPYGRGIGPWVERAAYFGCLDGNIGVCLLPARTETKWFQVLWDKAALLLFVKGRLKFQGEISCAPFPSVVAVFDGSGDVLLNQGSRLVDLGNVVVRGHGVIRYSVDGQRRGE